MSTDKTIKNSFYYLLQAVLANVVPFLTLPLFTRVLSPQDYGIIGLSAALAMALSGFVHLGLTFAYQRNYFHYRENPRQQAGLLYSTLAFVMVNFFIFSAAVYVGKDWLSTLIFQREGLGYVLTWDFAATHLMGVGQYFFLYFQNAGLASLFFWFSIAQLCLNMILSVVLICFVKVGFMGLIYAKFGAALLTALALLVYFMRFLPLVFDLRLVWENLKLSLPLTLRFFSKPLMTNFDKWLVSTLSSLSGTGIYAMSQKFAYVSFAGMTALDQVYVPKSLEMMIDQKDGKAGKAIAAYLMPFCYFSFLLCLVVCFFAEEVILVLLPPAFHGAIDLASILSLYYGLMFFGKLPHFLYSGKTFLIAALSFLNLGAMAVFCFLLVPRYGAMGAALGLLIAEFLVEALTFYVRQKQYRIEWPYRKLVAIITLFLCSGLMVVAARHFLGGYWQVLALKLSLMGVYVIVGFRSALWAPDMVLSRVKRFFKFNG